MRIQKKLGQNFLKSESIAKFIVSSAKISKNDIVYEIGTGRGILIPDLCKNAKKVISVEKDHKLYNFLESKFSGTKNLQLIHGDGFKQKEKFDIFISNLPYSESKKAIQWMLKQKFTHAILMLQDDFVEKLLAVGSQRRAISVLAQSGFKMNVIKKIGKQNFLPEPKIDSVIITFDRKTTISKELIQSVNLIFSLRRKKIQNIGKKFGLQIESNMRIEDMKNNEIIEFAKKIKKI
tara:strand:+ start:4380 stop:5084 length:705 start_codon:yes stop_codon:yes gene_type:complete